MANKIWTSVYNSLPIGWQSAIGSIVGNNSGSRNPNRNIGRAVMPIPLQRLVQSVQNWRDGLKELEYYIPFRVKQQQLFDDLIDEGHVAACMERRMDLTLLRDYAICDMKGKPLEDCTQWLKNQHWFIDYQRFVLLARFRGYCLISMGDIVSNETILNGLPNMKLLPHENVSPDRRNIASVVYAVSGEEWDKDEYKNWHIYVDTPPEIGRACCGYGILNKIAIPAILLRSNLTDNANYNEKFGQPVTWGKTSKTDDERTDFFNELRRMGASSTFVTDLNDELEFLESKGLGQGFKTFADLEMRCQKIISKNILGHADAMDSIPKRSGSAEGDSQTPTTPVSDALSDIKSKDGAFVAIYVNELLRKMQLHGVNLPKGFRFAYKNDDEEAIAKEKEYRRVEDYSSIAVKMKQAGLQMDPAQFTKETKIPCTIIEGPKPLNIPPAAPLSPQIKNKLDLLYSKKHDH